MSYTHLKYANVYIREKNYWYKSENSSEHVITNGSFKILIDIFIAGPAPGQKGLISPFCTWRCGWLIGWEMCHIP